MPKKLHRLVNKLKRQGKVKNPWAVANAALKKKSKKSK